MTIINKNRTLEDNGFELDDEPNHYKKSLEQNSMCIKIKISTSEKKFSIVAAPLEFSNDKYIDIIDNFDDFKKINKVFAILNIYGGYSIPEIITNKGCEQCSLMWV